MIGCNILRKLDRGLLEKFPVLGVLHQSESEIDSVHFRSSEEEVKSPDLNKEIVVLTDVLGRLNPSLNSTKGSQVLEGNFVELPQKKTKNKTESE